MSPEESVQWLDFIRRQAKKDNEERAKKRAQELKAEEDRKRLEKLQIGGKYL
jgi:hypothetical protein